MIAKVKYNDGRKEIYYNVVQIRRGLDKDEFMLFGYKTGNTPISLFRKKDNTRLVLGDNFLIVNGVKKLAIKWE